MVTSAISSADPSDDLQKQTNFTWRALFPAVVDLKLSRLKLYGSSPLHRRHGWVAGLKLRSLHAITSFWLLSYFLFLLADRCLVKARFYGRVFAPAKKRLMQALSIIPILISLPFMFISGVIYGLTLCSKAFLVSLYCWNETKVFELGYGRFSPMRYNSVFYKVMRPFCFIPFLLDRLSGFLDELLMRRDQHPHFYYDEPDTDYWLPIPHGKFIVLKQYLKNSALSLIITPINFALSVATTAFVLPLFLVGITIAGIAKGISDCCSKPSQSAPVLNDVSDAPEPDSSIEAVLSRNSSSAYLNTPMERASASKSSSSDAASESSSTDLNKPYENKLDMID